jgi:hypothetical protein
MVNNQLSALQARNKQKKNLYILEMTDTFNGEANYSWIRKYQTQSVSIRGAVTKLSKHYGRHFRKNYGNSREARYDAVGANICVFVEYFEKDEVTEINDYLDL